LSQHCHNHRDPAVFARRLADWRNRQVVYQVFVDRFAAGSDPRSRSAMYSAPRRLMAWSDQPRRGRYLGEAGACTHELEFWGGDLAGVQSKLAYIRDLGANVLYLNPIFKAYTNHKYDTEDYFEIDPQYGTLADLEALCEAAHQQGMRVILDGVLNHVGRRHAWFESARKSSGSDYRDWFSFADGRSDSYKSWRDVSNLPELRLENPAVRDALYQSPDSVVQRYLRWADGWRLDVANDLGPFYLEAITAAAHQARSDSLVVGEFFNYPAEWLTAIDGALNLFLGMVLLDLARGHISPGKAARIVADLVDDSGVEPLLRSWTVVSNHDKPRLRSELPDLRDRKFLWALQMALPGAPLIYYGEEIGLEGGQDPAQRGPMDWDLAQSDRAPEKVALKRLLEIRQEYQALQVGDYVPLAADGLFAFMRRTATVRDTVVVLANPGHKTISEPICPRESWLLDSVPLRDLVEGGHCKMQAGRIEAKVPPRTVQMWVADREDPQRYNFLKRVP
jgi:glycosidase